MKANNDVTTLGFNFHKYVTTATTILFWIFISMTMIFLLAPLLIVVVLSFQAQAYGGWPPSELSLQWYMELPDRFETLGITDALWSSIELGLATGLISTAIGGMAAFAIVRRDFRYQSIIETFILSPLIYPWIVVGLSLLLMVSWVNSHLGLNITLSFWTLLAGHVVFTLPYPARTIAANLQNFSDSIEEAATNLGATELDVFVNITLPVIRPGIISGFIFVFILSFNQYIISLFLSDAGTDTIPLVLFTLFFNTSTAQLAAIATLLMSGILTLVFVTEYFVGISEYI
jgi:ABC-type spermidine/putrescine transport system permease subunit II